MYGTIIEVKEREIWGRKNTLLAGQMYILLLMLDTDRCLSYLCKCITLLLIYVNHAPFDFFSRRPHQMEFCQWKGGRGREEKSHLVLGRGVKRRDLGGLMWIKEEIEEPDAMRKLICSGKSRFLLGEGGKSHFILRRRRNDEGRD